MSRIIYRQTEDTCLKEELEAYRGMVKENKARIAQLEAQVASLKHWKELFDPYICELEVQCDKFYKHNVRLRQQIKWERLESEILRPDANAFDDLRLLILPLESGEYDHYPPYKG